MKKNAGSESIDFRAGKEAVFTFSTRFGPGRVHKTLKVLISDGKSEKGGRKNGLKEKACMRS